MKWLTCMISLPAALLGILPGAMLAAPSAACAGLQPARPLPSSVWTATTALYTPNGGTWQPATTVQSLGRFRAVLTVQARGAARSNVTATMTMEHLSWEGYTKVMVPPIVRVAMQRTASSANNATFTADVMVPTVVPLEWSLLQFIVRGGQRRIEVRTGITIRGIAQQTPSNTVTVPQAEKFCAARPHLAYLPYAVYLHGYFEGIHDPMRNGPAQGVVFDRPRPIPANALKTRRVAHGLLVGGFDLPANMWATEPGELDCTNGRADGFSPDVAAVQVPSPGAP